MLLLKLKLEKSKGYDREKKRCDGLGREKSGGTKNRKSEKLSVCGSLWNEKKLKSNAYSGKRLRKNNAKNRRRLINCASCGKRRKRRKGNSRSE